MSEYYKILKLKNGASQEEIQASYDKLKIELYPKNFNKRLKNYTPLMILSSFSVFGAVCEMYM
jgi:hypothetical protein